MVHRAKQQSNVISVALKGRQIHSITLCDCDGFAFDGVLFEDFDIMLNQFNCMDLMGISISTGSACDSVNTEISHVLQAIRLNEDYAKGTIRISLGKYNTEEEVNIIAAFLINILG